MATAISDGARGLWLHPKIPLGHPALLPTSEDIVLSPSYVGSGLFPNLEGMQIESHDIMKSMVFILAQRRDSNRVQLARVYGSFIYSSHDRITVDCLTGGKGARTAASAAFLFDRRRSSTPVRRRQLFCRLPTNFLAFTHALHHRSGSRRNHHREANVGPILK